MKLCDSNAVLRVPCEMVDVRLLVNPRFLLIWNDYSLSILRIIIPNKEESRVDDESDVDHLAEH